VEIGALSLTLTNLPIGYNLVLSEYIQHYHNERCHQGIGNVIPLLITHAVNDCVGLIECHERLGGTLKFYHREAA
jgi:hypothetical protein